MKLKHQLIRNPDNMEIWIKCLKLKHEEFKEIIKYVYNPSDYFWRFLIYLVNKRIDLDQFSYQNLALIAPEKGIPSNKINYEIVIYESLDCSYYSCKFYEDFHLFIRQYIDKDF